MKQIKVTLQAVEKSFTKDSKEIKYLEYFIRFPSGEMIAVQPKEWDKRLMRALVTYNEGE